MRNDQLYTPAFFDYHLEGSRSSARHTVPLVLQFLQPRSVIDVGCGIGTWLVEFKNAGIADYLGTDGDYVDRGKLLIETERFVPHDLTRPFRLDRRFDLAVCLEVAEHLPKTSADGLVESLVQLAPVVLFSGAVPYQGGDGHVNEQWPDYWRERFDRQGYVVVDCLRRHLWNNRDVKYWYAQNMLLFVARDQLSAYPKLAEVVARDGENPPLALVHPELYLTLRQAYAGALKESQTNLMRLSLKLREVNLLIFPDWSQPAEEVLNDLRRLFRALLGHFQGPKVTLVIQFGAAQNIANQLVAQAHREILVPDGKSVPGPWLTAIGENFGPHEWTLLVGVSNRRVVLRHDDAAAIARVGADRLSVVSLEAIEMQQGLS